MRGPARIIGGTAGGIFRYFVRHGTAANLLMVLLIAAGMLTYPKMRAQFFPDVVTDSISVSVTWDGAGASDVDAAIIQILEPALLTVEGVSASSARATEGRASVSLDFEPGYDMDQATKDVQDVLDGLSTLPEDAEDPVQRSGAFRDRVTDVVITGPVGLDQLARFGDEMIARLFNVGVNRTSISGYAAPSTVVEVPMLALMEHDVTMAQIAAAIAAESGASPAGDVSADARLRTGVAKQSADEIAGVVLRTNPDGSTLTVGDVAQVRVEGADRDIAIFVGDNPAISIRVDRSAQGDAIGIQASVEKVAAEVQANLPEGVTIDLVSARAEQISARLRILLENGAQGLALVLALLFLFLNARTALWVALGIPVAMMTAVSLMYLGGLTFNMISLFALIITLGIVVDDAIVVGEHADHRARLGESPEIAAESAAARMFSPVLSATLTTVIAFYGLALVGGRFGDLISDIPFTVIAVLAASLVECFIILPNHLAHSVVRAGKATWYDLPSRLVNRGFGWVRRVLFRPFLTLAIRARYPVLAAVLLVLALQVSQLIRGDVQWRFFSAPEQGQVTGNFAMLPGATRDDSVAMMAELQRAAEAVAARFEAEHGASPLAYVTTQIGGNSGRALSGADTKESYQLGAISIDLIDADLRPYTSSAFVTALQDEIVQHPMAETVSFRSWGAGPGGDGIEVSFFGSDTRTLKAAAEALKTDLARFPEVSGLEDNLAYDKAELVLELTPRGQALGFGIEDLGRTLRNMLGGIEAATFPDGTRSATVRVELPEGEITADFLERAMVRSPSGVYVPVADIVTVTRETGFSTIRRENGILQITVNGSISEDDADRAAAVQEALEQDILPTLETRFGVESATGGLRQQERDFLGDAQSSLVIVLTAIYLVLAWIFASWTRPIVVMAVIPFGLVGAIYGHGAWGIPMSLFSVVGLLGMVGIIINDSIVLVTTIDEYARSKGMAQAIVDGTTDRLRAVFLTTATTVLGLAPLLFEPSSQAEFLKPTVVTLVYGLGFGMVIVLLVVPLLLACQEDVKRLRHAARRALRAPRGAIRVPAVLAVSLSGGLMAALILPYLLGQAGWALVAGILPLAGQGIGVALGLFVAALGIGLILIYLITFAAVSAHNTRNGHSEVG